MSLNYAASGSYWTREQDKAFENALANHPENAHDRWERIAGEVEGKSMEDIKRHYNVLLEDVHLIESGCVRLPKYNSSLSSQGMAGPHSGHGEELDNRSHFSINEFNEAQAFQSDHQERRKGIPWTEDEHRLFISGLEKYGKGDWRSISRLSVLSRTPTQVASHAQKYFKRLKSINKGRQRSSIHDITTSTTSCVNTNVSAFIPMIIQSNIPVTRGFTTPWANTYGGMNNAQPNRGLLGSSLGTHVNFPVNPTWYSMSYRSEHKQRSNFM